MVSTVRGRLVGEHAPGAPVWVRLMSTDLDGAKAFYSTLFGWSYVEEPIGRLPHVTCLLDGERVAGIASDGTAPERLRGWLTYLGVRDMDASIVQALARGATLIRPAREFRAAGIVAVIRDPQDALVALYEPRARSGTRRLNTPGSLCWNELNTQDPEASKSFYRELFGYGEIETQSPTGARYDMLTVDGHPVLGVLGLEPELIPFPARWLAYFAVESLDVALDTLRSLGGTIVIGPSDTRHGRSAVVRDPQRAVFCLTELWEPLR